MCPGTRGSGEVPPARVPLDVGHSIVICHAKLLDAGGPFIGCISPDRIIRVDIEVPELQLGFRRRADGRKDDVTPAR
jgi:hypothetical protein